MQSSINEQRQQRDVSVDILQRLIVLISSHFNVSLLAHHFCSFLPTVIILSQILSSSSFYCPFLKSFRNARKDL
jgi:hypothetical protein